MKKKHTYCAPSPRKEVMRFRHWFTEIKDSRVYIFSHHRSVPRSFFLLYPSSFSGFLHSPVAGIQFHLWGCFRWWGWWFGRTYLCVSHLFL